MKMKIFISMKVPPADDSLRLAADLLTAAVNSTGHQPFLATDEIVQRGLTNLKDFMPFVREHIQTTDLSSSSTIPNCAAG